MPKDRKTILAESHASLVHILTLLQETALVDENDNDWNDPTADLASAILKLEAHIKCRVSHDPSQTSK